MLPAACESSSVAVRVCGNAPSSFCFPCMLRLSDNSFRFFSLGSSMSVGSSLREQYDRDGYIVLPSTTIPLELLARLQVAADKAIGLGKTGEWGQVRRTPSGSVWGINNVTHPEMTAAISPTHTNPFLEYMALDGILGTCATLLGVELPSEVSSSTPQGLQWELCNLLCMPEHPYRLAWHRDYVDIECMHGDAEAAELEKQNSRARGVQWNTALYADCCFIFVPGSHRRPKTAEESRLLATGPKDTVVLPGQQIVHLLPGETVMYEANLLHRGEYAGHPTPRATLHACVGDASTGHHRVYVVAKSSGVDWTSASRFIAELPSQLRIPIANLWANQKRAETELTGTDSVAAAVAHHNARADVSTFGLVGNKDSLPKDA